MVPYKHSKSPDLDAVYIFDLKIAQCQGLKLFSRQLCDYFEYRHPDTFVGKSLNSTETSQETETLFDKRPPPYIESPDALICGSGTEKPVA